MLNDVRFTDAANGLGRLPAQEDYVSAMVVPIGSPIAAWSGANFKRYLSPAEAVADGITTSSGYAVLAYQIERFFSEAGNSELFVVDSNGLTAQLFHSYTGGRVRQVYYNLESTYATLSADVGTLQVFAEALEVLHAPCSIITSVTDTINVDGGASQPDIRALGSDRVSVVIAGSHTGTAATVTASNGDEYIPAAGAVLGALARGGVHESIAWVERYNFVQGAELEQIRFSDGNTYASKTVSELDALNTKGYIFFRKSAGIAGSYVNESSTAASRTSNFAFIENGRVIDKAKRVIRAALLPDVARPVEVAEDGTLDPAFVGYLTAKASRPLELMEGAGEISAFDVTIDPDQDVLSTSKVLIVGRIIPRGVARNIEFNLGYTVTL